MYVFIRIYVYIYIYYTYISKQFMGEDVNQLVTDWAQVDPGCR